MNSCVKYLLFLAAIIPALPRCTAVIEVDIGESEPYLVIYGTISNQYDTHMVTIQRSKPFYEEGFQEGISGARVKVISGEEVFYYDEIPYSEGQYFHNEGFEGIEGREYTLEIELDFDGDGQPEIYTAKSVMPYKVEVDSIDIQHSKVLRDKIEILVYGRLPQMQSSWLSVRLLHNMQVVNDSLSGINIWDEKYFSSKQIDGVPAYYLDQGKNSSQLSDGTWLTLRIESIEEQYAQFLSRAKAQAGDPNPIFSGPPANVPTNICCTSSVKTIPVAGFFAAYSLDEASSYYYREE